MSTKTSTAEFLVEQLGAGVTAKKMFGEYGLYLDGKLFALLCDDLLFVKPTPGGRAFLGEAQEAPPYPGAKNALVVAADRWDDAEWMTELAAITTRELPSPASKHSKAGKRPPVLTQRGAPVKRIGGSSAGAASSAGTAAASNGTAAASNGSASSKPAPAAAAAKPANGKPGRGGSAR